MIKIEKAEVYGFEHAIRGMRNPMNSWERSDSCEMTVAEIVGHPCNDGLQKEFVVGENDISLMEKLAKAGSVHAKYRRMIVVWVDITAPLYFWKEFDTYKVGTVANSCSTMHTIADKPFDISDFSIDHLMLDNIKDFITSSLEVLGVTIDTLNIYRDLYLRRKDKRYWWQMIQLLPSSYNQKRTVMLNYEVLANMYAYRKEHKLDEWIEFCKWIETLPLSQLITGEREGVIFNGSS